MLPIELWTHICSFACLDDGSTAVSLSEASHLLRAAAEPYKWRTISVHNARQLISLTTCLESSARNVEFLYAEAMPPLNNAGKLPLIEFYKQGICDRSPGPSPEDILVNADELILHAISRLLIAVRTTVRIAHVRSDYRHCVFYPVKFERLEELTLEGSFDCSYRDYITSLPVNPTIRRLKFDNTQLRDSSTLLDSIRAYAPGATHIFCRLWNLWTVQQTIAQLSMMLPLDSPYKSAQPKVFPSTLEKLYIHPGRSEPPGHCGTGYYLNLHAKQALHNFSRMPESQSRVVLLKEEKYDRKREELRHEEAKEEWLDRIYGGLGCWDDSDRMDTPW